MRRAGFALAMAVASAGFLGAAPALLADDTGPAPGGRAVRLSNVDGQVKLSLDGQMLTDQAVANVPLFEGTRVITTDEGRAEIQFEDGSVARISPNSSLTLTVLKGPGAGAEAVITLNSGLGYFEIQSAGQAGSIRVGFGDCLVTANGFTVMRVDMDNAPGELAVFSGNAHLEHGNALALDLHGGESVALDRGDPGHYTLMETIEPDSWDSWNSDRDQELGADASTRTPATKGYPDSGNPAWSDLDANGSWYDVPGQGNVWSPYDASNPGWDPYGNGYWMGTPQYGNIWVSGYGWGYLPYQCGLWNYYDSFGWGWAPGTGGCRPWWGGGLFGVNVGSYPGWYRLPIVPRAPHRPMPLSSGGQRGLIAVNRRPFAGAPAALPARDRTSVVTIAGHTVQPQHAVSPRAAYARTASGSGYVNRAPGTAVYGTNSAGRYTGGSQHVSAPPPARAPSSGGAPPASHPSAGGGGGGGSHGGGGGGGGSHH